MLQVKELLTSFQQAIADRQQLLVSSVLQSVPGVMVARTGGLGNVTSVFVRGGESNYNKILLDGIPLNEPGGMFEFSNLAEEDLDRIEIVRGPQSALFGSDAMASYEPKISPTKARLAFKSFRVVKNRELFFTNMLLADGMRHLGELSDRMGLPPEERARLREDMQETIALSLGIK